MSLDGTAESVCTHRSFLPRHFGPEITFPSQLELPSKLASFHPTYVKRICLAGGRRINLPHLVVDEATKSTVKNARTTNGAPKEITMEGLHGNV